MADRLNSAHTQAQFEVKKQIQHWKNVANGYKSLSDHLTTLPQKMTHDVMVPFGPIAFMPGKLVHTNELLVHLGDSWFAEATCSQGQKIIHHRLQMVNQNLEDLNKTLRNLEKKTEFSHEVLSEGENSHKTVEIKEKVPENYLHPSRCKRISKMKEGDRRMKPPSVSIQPQQHGNENLMTQLKELEKLEVNEAEPGNYTSAQPEEKAKKRVSWKMEPTNSESQTKPLCIRFKHTSPVNTSKPIDDTTPGDIGKNKTETNKSNINQMNTALLERVVEHKSTATSSHQQNVNRKVSKFKANRTR